MIYTRHLRRLLTASSLILGLLTALPASALTSSVLQPDSIHSQTITDIVTSLNRDHYTNIVLNDELSGKVLDQYLDSLDPSKAFFYRSDIDEFQQYRTVIDDEINSGDLTAAYAIFNRYQQRTQERLSKLIATLENPDYKVDFNRDETILTDRETSQWPASEAEMDEFWRKRLKSALLGLKLADKPVEEAKKLLIKRYKSQLNRALQTNNEDVFQSFANALTMQFDPHTQYFSPRLSENFNINMSLSLEGIGAVLQSENDNTKVVRLVPAGPADKAGQLKPADLIVGVGQGEDGEIEDVVGWRLDEVVALIRGPKDTVVRLDIIPADGDDSQHKIIKITRNKVKLEEQAAHSKVIELEHQGKPYKLGVISIPAFYIDFAALQRGEPDYKSTTRDTARLIKELTDEGIDGLIIDLRNNGGGSLLEANELVGLFISRGPTVQIRDPQGRVNIQGDADPKVAYSGPMAVLVNRLSASASEIFAGAIQDYQRGLIVGSQTFGKGTVQTLSPLHHGQIKLTHAKFYRISGESTQHKGVIPDVTLPTLYDTDEIGESSLEGALPWDMVHEVPHQRYVNFSTILPELNKRHIERTKFNPDFLYMNAQIKRMHENKKDKELSLNEATLKAERDKSEQWLLDQENQRRAAKKLPAIKALSELDDLLEKDSQGRTISPEQEAILTETGNVLLDMIELTHNYMALKN
ncbi:carboxyl-terminal processing protease [Amphritea atlantica]|uniref:Carboxyl-terminal processing protease n=1 Tax=Amphritea atlantica TaxID=355243 RepID=A0A1H9KPX8_9GAMM|nr:carboxy terminal-processing peptidase [Amphritea atlantica]SER01138.1 carboxyl-terminal processing protease [Amphritea atlantica]